jgi:hypothetical protein
MNFAKNKIYLPKEEGGLGLFNVETFLTGQQAAWIFRANISTRDNWRFKLCVLCNGDVLCAGAHLIKKEANPVLYGLSENYQNFKKNMTVFIATLLKQLSLTTRYFLGAQLTNCRLIYHIWD